MVLIVIFVIIGPCKAAKISLSQFIKFREINIG